MSKLTIKIHQTDGITKSFVQSNADLAGKIWEGVEPGRLFTQQRVVIGSEHSKTVILCKHINRIDFIQDSYQCWEFRGGYSDVVELSEAEFRDKARLDDPLQMERRDQRRAVGDLLVSFLELCLSGGARTYLMVEFPVRLPAESQAFTHFLLGSGSLLFRLKFGGHGVVNLANLISYAVYPGVAQLPSDAWLAEPS